MHVCTTELTIESNSFINFFNQNLIYVSQICFLILNKSLHRHIHTSEHSIHVCYMYMYVLRIHYNQNKIYFFVPFYSFYVTINFL
ncbi:hypothetical protein PUN28_014494 [Cardiocondyla obscurior]|uniref:Uncharacterized protein n=1 Tax=Cardiocondyla obscurior TaxID=286306 RepID=A0AAW2F447_9HYME